MNISEIINQLSNTPGRLDKEKILKDNIDNQKLKDIFYLVFNPFIIFNIKKVPPIDYSSKTIEDIFIELTKTLHKLHNREITGNSAKDYLKQTIDGLNKENYNCICKIINKDLKCGVNTKTIQKVYGNNFVPIFEVQLANKWEQDKNYKIDSWYSSSKLDGIRGVYMKGKLFSRNMKLIEGFEELEKELNMISQKYNLELIDGELFSKDIPFQVIQGYVMSRKNINVEDKEKIKFCCFAVQKKEGIFTTKEMIYLLNLIKEQNDLKYVEILEYKEIKNEEILEETQKMIDKGYEGLMLRHPNVSYNNGRSDHLLKVKFFNEIDLTIIGFIEGEGKYKGMLGALDCHNEVINTEVGTGFNDEMRKEIWDNQNKYLNKIVSIKYQNLTDDGSSLRFPVFLGIKEDR